MYAYRFWSKFWAIFIKDKFWSKSGNMYAYAYAYRFVKSTGLLLYKKSEFY